MTQEQFVEAYNRLCQESGFALQAQVGLKQQIDGTFTIGAQLAIVKINQTSGGAIHENNSP